MKALPFLVVIVIALAAGGCASGPAGGAQGTPGSGIPATFAQKVLIEEFTGAWCGWCPDGARELHGLLEANAGRLIAVVLHYKDSVATPATDELMKGVGGCPGYPAALVNRVRYGSASGTLAGWRNEWAAAVAQARRGRATCGLRLDTRLDGAQARVTVTAGFAAVPAGDVRLAVMVTEDEVAESAQRNFQNDDRQSPFYRKGDPIPGWTHMRVLRATLTPVFGESIERSSMAPGSVIERTYAWTVPRGVKAADVRVVGILNSFGPGATDKSVVNAQEVRLGQSGGWN
jgi:hypothetical protein